jgi:hypothetical protein
MPAQTTIVTFTDAEEDQFPIRVAGTGSKDKLIEQARKQFRALVNQGELSPTEPFHPTQVELV